MSNGGGGGKQRTDEWYLGSILDKMFAELSTDGKRLPVSKCISYLFDNSNNNYNNTFNNNPFSTQEQRLAAIAFANPSQLSPEQEQLYHHPSSSSATSTNSTYSNNNQ